MAATALPTESRLLRRPAARSCFAASALLWALAATGPAHGQGSDAMAEAIEAELARQEALLRELDAESEAGAGADPGLAPDGSAASRPPGSDERDPRAAPRAPEERELPVEIFEEKRVKVPAGRFGAHPAQRFTKRILDADRDGSPELVRWIDPESGLMVHQESDTNYDGVLDAFSDYEWGSLVRRTLDRDDDGRRDTWERYEQGRMTNREVDRDGDGVRDAFYVYEQGSLAREQHDANGDGRVDLRIEYSARVRTRAEEDVDRDGRFDLWTHYAKGAQGEIVTRIERDDRGDGQPDTFETFQEEGGRARLARREEDLDEDGQIDVVSFYRAGKIVRREIRSADLAPQATQASDQNT